MKQMLVFSGAPCSGKDSAVKEILKTISLPKIPMSDELRKLEKTNPQAWPEIQTDMENGYLVADEYTVPAIRRALEAIADLPNDSALLNGVVRSVRQAQEFWVISQQRGWEVVIFDVRATDDICARRSVKRFADQGRKDDNPEVFARRLKVFKEHTMPAIDFLVRKGATYHGIDGNGTNDEAVEQIMAKLVLPKARAEEVKI